MGSATAVSGVGLEAGGCVAYNKARWPEFGPLLTVEVTL